MANDALLRLMTDAGSPLFMQSGAMSTPPQVLPGDAPFGRALPNYNELSPAELAAYRLQQGAQPSAGRADIPPEHVAGAMMMAAPFMGGAVAGSAVRGVGALARLLGIGERVAPAIESVLPGAEAAPKISPAEFGYKPPNHNIGSVGDLRRYLGVQARTDSGRMTDQVINQINDAIRSGGGTPGLPATGKMTTDEVLAMIRSAMQAGK